jgi:hypothetical protein
MTLEAIAKTRSLKAEGFGVDAGRILTNRHRGQDPLGSASCLLLKQVNLSNAPPLPLNSR